MKSLPVGVLLASADSIHDNSGEGYAIYINGKPLIEVKAGVTGWRKQRLSGSHIWQEFLDEFKGGKVTIAVANFPNPS